MDDPCPYCKEYPSCDLYLANGPGHYILIDVVPLEHYCWQYESEE